MGGCGSDYGMEINADEMEIHMPLDPPPVQYPSYSPPEDNDPNTTIDDCDYWDYECNGGTGGGTVENYQEIEKFDISKLDATQKALLNKAINNLKNECWSYILLEEINVVKVEVNSNIDFQAIYQPKPNTIYFRSNSSIDQGSLASELFHAYQQQVYGTLDNIQDDPSNVGGSNIEFEEKAYNIQRDIVNGGLLEEWGGTGPLIKWLTDLEQNHHESNIILSQGELVKWFTALEFFKEYHTPCEDMYCKPINYNLKPTAIIKLMSKLRSSNCY
jgi:hypothetical protein